MKRRTISFITAVIVAAGAVLTIPATAADMENAAVEVYMDMNESEREKFIDENLDTDLQYLRLSINLFLSKKLQFLNS